MNFIHELRGAARRCENLLTRCQLIEHADRIDSLVIALYRATTTESLQKLTCEWTRAYWAMERALPEKVTEKHDV